MSFESDMARMEEITNRLQDNSVPLEESIKLFEEGVGIARRVEKELTEIERKVEILTSPPDGTDPSPSIDMFSNES